MNALPLSLHQSAFQDYLDCPRRFELRFLNETVWPAAQGSPLTRYEKLTELGITFHQLCHQFFSGIDADLLSATITEPNLLELWEAFLPYGKSLLSLPHVAEQILRIPFGDHFLVAKFDLIVQQSDSSFMIIDWKTASTKPDRTSLANRVQTSLYPFIFLQAAGDLFPVSDPENLAITMQYYYPLSSTPKEVFAYSEDQHNQSLRRITGMISEIEGYIADPAPFPLTDQLERCQYCLYRSYCERGYDSSPLPLGLELENEDLSNTHFELDLIKEIEF